MRSKRVAFSLIGRCATRHLRRKDLNSPDVVGSRRQPTISTTRRLASQAARRVNKIGETALQPRLPSRLHALSRPSCGRGGSGFRLGVSPRAISSVASPMGSAALVEIVGELDLLAASSLISIATLAPRRNRRLRPRKGDLPFGYATIGKKQDST